MLLTHISPQKLLKIMIKKILKQLYFFHVAWYKIIHGPVLVQGLDSSLQ